MLRFSRLPSGAADTFFVRLQLFFANPTDVPNMSVLLHRHLTGWVVIALVQAQMLWLFLGRLRTLHHDGFQGLVQQFSVMPIGRCHDGGQGTTPSLGQQAALRPLFAPIRGVAANLVAFQAHLPQRCIGRSPFPLHLTQVFTLLDQDRPYALKQSQLPPVLESAMNGSVISIDAGNMVPLTARAKPKDDRIQNAARIGSGSASALRGIEFVDQRFDAVP